MKNTKILFIIITYTFIKSTVFGSSYYISQESTGNASGYTYANRMSIFVHNSRNFEPGDVIYLTGNIMTPVVPQSSGEKGKEIIYDGNDNKNPPGNIRVSSSQIAFPLNGQSYLKIQNLELSGGKEGFSRNKGWSSYITFVRNKIHGMRNRGIVGGRLDHWVIGGSYGDGNTIYDCGIDTAGGDIALSSEASDVLISYNHLYGNTINEGVDGVVTEGAGPGIIIEANKIHDHWREDGVDIKGSNGVVIRCNEIFGHKRQMGITIQFDSSDIKIYGNRIYNNGSGIWLRDGSGKGTWTHDIEIRSNAIHDNLRNGIVNTHRAEWDMGVRDVIIENNIIAHNSNKPEDISNCGLYIGSGSNWFISKNIFYMNRFGDSQYYYRQVYIGNGQTDSTVLSFNIYYTEPLAPEIYWGNIGWKTLPELKLLNMNKSGQVIDPGLKNSNALEKAYHTLIESVCSNSSLQNNLRPPGNLKLK